MNIGTKIHYLDDTDEAYDVSNTGVAFVPHHGMGFTEYYEVEVNTGDILVIESEGVVGVADAWPVAVTKEAGNLHHLGAGNMELADALAGGLEPRVTVASLKRAIEVAERYGFEVHDEMKGEAK